MRKTNTIITIFLFLLCGCSSDSIRGNGVIKEIHLSPDSVTGIYCDNECEVNITIGDTPSITISLDENMYDHLKLDVSSRLFICYLYDDENIHFYNYTFKVDITLPHYEYIALYSESHAIADSVNITDSLTIILDLESTFSGNSKCSDVEIDLSLDSKFEGSISAQSAHITAEYSSELTNNAVISEADVVLSGGSKVTLSVADLIEGNIAGNSHITCYGSPQNETKLNDSSTISFY